MKFNRFDIIKMIGLDIFETLILILVFCLFIIFTKSIKMKVILLIITLVFIRGILKYILDIIFNDIIFIQAELIEVEQKRSYRATRYYYDILLSYNDQKISLESKGFISNKYKGKSIGVYYLNRSKILVYTDAK